MYKLPEVEFVGGETYDLKFRLHTKSGRIFDAAGAVANFAIVSSVNRTGTPLISKPMNILADDDGIDSILTVTLLPTETVDLSGKFIYQLTIRDLSGEVEIPGQGILRITDNRDKEFIL